MANMRMLLYGVAVIAMLAVLAGCAGDSMRAVGSGESTLYRHAAMNCPVCNGKGSYRLGHENVRCYHCRGVGLVMGWSQIKPSEDTGERTHALEMGEGD
jgi:DnaJ-class molecular chaperone